MARRHYLVSYDVSDDKRRNRIFKMLGDLGNHVQFSVFLCELSRRELAQLRSGLTECVHQRDDQVMILDLGPAHLSLETAMEVLGRPHEPLVRTLIV
jgi:CRISPR-associated protein Cas2